MLKRVFIFLFIFAFFFLSGCVGDKYGEPDEAHMFCHEGRERSFVDDEGDVEGDVDFDKKFVDLTNLKVIFGSDCVGVEIGLAELSPILTINHLGLEDGGLNYEWSIYFDIDDDNSLSDGDLALSVVYSKFPESEEREEHVASAAQYLLMKKAGERMIAEAFVYAGISDNVFRLSADNSLSSELSKISYTTKVKFVAFHNDGTTPYRDVYPNSDSFE